MSVFEAAWVIARRDFVAQVFSRNFILFLIAPVLLFGFAFFVGGQADRAANPTVVALVADGATTEALTAARARLAAGTSETAFPEFRTVAPAENVRVQARALLADETGAYSAVLSGSLERPVLTGPERIDEFAGRRVQLIVDEAKRAAALEAAGVRPAQSPVIRDVTANAAGNLQSLRRGLARGGQGLIFAITIMLSTLSLSTLVEEKSNKVIEVLAAAVPLDSVFLGKLLSMLGISLVGLSIWGGAAALAYGFVGLATDWVSLPDVSPAIGWPIWIALLLLYYAATFMVLAALFLGIGAQASNIREIQTISMPVVLLQLMVLLLAMNAIGNENPALAWLAYLVPFSSPLAMAAYGAQYESLWPHLLALVWQALWIVIIIRASARLFRRSVLKSAPGGSFFRFWPRRTSA
ncbi:MAG TPA: ABC transporter permease [Allosphingosinicella sp.]|nr:ABC transporter permease [Allosphingosinicella sp.]